MSVFFSTGFATIGLKDVFPEAVLSGASFASFSAMFGSSLPPPQPEKDNNATTSTVAMSSVIIFFIGAFLTDMGEGLPS